MNPRRTPQCKEARYSTGSERARNKNVWGIPTFAERDLSQSRLEKGSREKQKVRRERAKVLFLTAEVGLNTSLLSEKKRDEGEKKSGCESGEGNTSRRLKNTTARANFG